MPAIYSSLLDQNRHDDSKIFSNQVLIRTSVTLLAFIVCIAVVFFQHVFLIPKNDPFNPLETCKAPPTGCWDAYNKQPHPCSRYHSAVQLRPGISTIPDQVNCYKSIYWNLDQTSLAIITIFLFWFYLMMQVIIRTVEAVLSRNFHVPSFLSLLLSLQVAWYSTSVPIHYLNDRNHNMLLSQFYFSATEVVCIMILAYHVQTTSPKIRYAIWFLGGTALAHILQMLMDESMDGVFSTILKLGRNGAMLMSDILNFWAAWSLSRGNRTYVQAICIIAISQIVLFQFLFTDIASFKFFN